MRVLASSSPEPAPFDTAALRQLKVLVVGATGGCGKNVVDVLVEQGVQTRALVRDPAKAVRVRTEHLHRKHQTQQLVREAKEADS